jgi:hypothetical protein
MKNIKAATAPAFNNQQSGNQQFLIRREAK